MVPSSRNRSSLPSQLADQLADSFPPDPRSPSPVPPRSPSLIARGRAEDDGTLAEDGDDWITEPDGFGVFRRYFDVLPQRDPLATQPLEDVCDAPGLGEAEHDLEDAPLTPRSHDTPSGIKWL